MILNKQYKMNKKGIYETPQEIAELYIKSGLKTKEDLNVLIRESAKLFLFKTNKEEAINTLKPFHEQLSSLYTLGGLIKYIETIGISSIDFTDPLTGRIEDSVYITLKDKK